jgi:hypothetical protein
MTTTLNIRDWKTIAEQIDLEALGELIDKFVAARSTDRASSRRGWTPAARRACDLQQTLGTIADYARDLGPEHWGPIKTMLCEREVIGYAMRYMRLSR